MASNVTSGGVLVVDFGAQYAQLIARRVREANVYSELVPHSITAAQVLEKNPAAIILSGGPFPSLESVMDFKRWHRVLVE
jgi:GMP synthase (glutamine-hydrolysing)